jgi:hypothetical protein
MLEKTQDDVSEAIWSGGIPAITDTSVLHYFIQAADSSGRVEKNPIGGWHTFLALPTDACNEWIVGDLNNTGNLDIFDILGISDNIISQELTGICADSVSDINNDGQSTLIDVILLVNLVMNE